eukprot:2311284-Pyramimonas_sp.AAC.1
MELQTGSAEYEKVKAFNDKISTDSAGRMRLYECEAEFASYTCGHTSMGLRCLYVEVPAPQKDPERFDRISQDGLLSMK